VDQVQPTKKAKSEFHKLLIPIFAVFLIGYISGIFLPIIQPKIHILPSNNDKVNYAIGPSSIVTSQQANAMGVIVSANDKSVRVKGSDGQIAEFELSPDYTVTVSRQATSSAKLVSAVPLQTANSQGIYLNQKAILSLTLKNSQYLVTNINYPTIQAK